MNSFFFKDAKSYHFVKTGVICRILLSLAFPFTIHLLGL